MTQGHRLGESMGSFLKKWTKIFSGDAWFFNGKTVSMVVRKNYDFLDGLIRNVFGRSNNIDERKQYGRKLQPITNTLRG